MANPILTMLNQSGMMKQNNLLGLLSSLKSGNPEQMARQMMSTNPQFKRFIEANQGKSPEQIARENGIDINTIMNLLK